MVIYITWRTDILVLDTYLIVGQDTILVYLPSIHQYCIYPAIKFAETNVI
jgi:hypothetical protein